jgi:hypothetical protein
MLYVKQNVFLGEASLQCTALDVTGVEQRAPLLMYAVACCLRFMLQRLGTPAHHKTQTCHDPPSLHNPWFGIDNSCFAGSLSAPSISLQARVSGVRVCKKVLERHKKLQAKFVARECRAAQQTTILVPQLDSAEPQEIMNSVEVVTVRVRAACIQDTESRPALTLW